VILNPNIENLSIIDTNIDMSKNFLVLIFRKEKFVKKEIEEVKKSLLIT
jgi:hypothetical protein